MEILGSNKTPITPSQVVAAATKCIYRFGVAKTSMIDIAKELGVSRQTVHRVFDTRADLLSAISDDRSDLLAKRLADAFAAFDSFEEALVEGSMLSLRVATNDPILLQIQERADHALDKYMFRGSPKIQQIMLDLWGPIIDRARTEGVLRDGIPTDWAVEWIRNVHAMATMRDDYSEEQMRKMLKDFLIPSLLIR